MPTGGPRMQNFQNIPGGAGGLGGGPAGQALSLARRIGTQPIGADPRPGLAGTGVQQGMQAGGAMPRSATPFDLDEPDVGYQAQLKDADEEADQLAHIVERRRKRKRGGAAKKALALAKRRRGGRR